MLGAHQAAMLGMARGGGAARFRDEFSGVQGTLLSSGNHTPDEGTYLSHDGIGKLDNADGGSLVIYPNDTWGTYQTTRHNFPVPHPTRVRLISSHIWKSFVTTRINGGIYQVFSRRDSPSINQLYVYQLKINSGGIKVQTGLVRTINGVSTTIATYTTVGTPDAPYTSVCKSTYDATTDRATVTVDGVVRINNVLCGFASSVGGVLAEPSCLIIANDNDGYTSNGLLRFEADTF